MTRKENVTIDGKPHLVTTSIDQASVHVSVNELLPKNQYRLVGMGTFRVGQIGAGHGRVMMAAIAHSFKKILDGDA